MENLSVGRAPGYGLSQHLGSPADLTRKGDLGLLLLRSNLFAKRAARRIRIDPSPLRVLFGNMTMNGAAKIG